uniref:SJCHGC01149 protein n=1 Tax=Schistosoma japonicum TaxID=6182 RepID=Q5DAF6_SCHJA|nr:SJCHGC01149 protein [Schistosoma japonicum]
MQKLKVTNRLCRLPGRLDGKLVIVTGANIGCGLELSGELARRGCTVIMACRDLEKGYLGKELLLDRFGDRSQDNWKKSPAGPGVEPFLQPIKTAQLIIEHLDLACLESIREFAKNILRQYTRLDILIHNAGMMATSYMETHDGFELQMGVNHLGPVLLTELLLPLLYNGTSSRIIVIASNLYQQGEIDVNNLNLRGEQYGPFKAYNQSKLANVMYVRELAKHLDGLKVIPMSVHPGAVRTEISYTGDHRYQLFLRAVGISPWEGAQTALYCTLIEDPVPGGYYSNCEREELIDKAMNESLGRRLWNVSRELVGLPPNLLHLPLKNI